MSDESSTQKYFHGAGALQALNIIDQGFSLPAFSRRLGQFMLGRGVYVTARIDVAERFGDVLVAARLAPGTRILWLDGRYEQRVVDALRREFGSEILDDDFAKALPSNKRLTRR